jgi:hypothetical protein
MLARNYHAQLSGSCGHSRAMAGRRVRESGDFDRALI